MQAEICWRSVGRRWPSQNSPPHGSVYGLSLAFGPLPSVPQPLGRRRPGGPGRRVACTVTVGWPQAPCRAWPRAGTRGGARACRPRCVRIFSITGRSRMAAMILSSPVPQFGQCCISISKAQASAKTNLYSSYVVANTRLSSRAQLMRPGRTWTVSASHWTPDAATPGTSSSLGGPCGTTSERSLALGASAPWKKLAGASLEGTRW